MNKGKKAVFFDIDGTLFGIGKGISYSAVEGIKRLRKNGHLALINTGRSRSNIDKNELGGIEFDGIVASCGTYVEYKGHCMKDVEWSQDAVERVTGYLRNLGMGLILEGSRHMYYYPTDESLMDKAYNSYLEQKKDSVVVSADEHKGNIHINKLSFRAPDKSGMKEAVKELEKDYSIILHNAVVAELIPQGYTKASGIEYICDTQGIPWENTYAFGDSNNDVDMLRYVSYGVAMGNGTRSAKESADYITADIDKDGVFRGLQYYGLI